MPRRPPPSDPAPPLEPRNREWTFFTNHAHVLICLAANPEAILRHIAATVGITERGVQKIIGDLEEAGFLTRDRVGRRNVYRLHLNQPLRHPVEQHRTIGDIVHALYPTAGTVTSSRKRSA